MSLMMGFINFCLPISALDFIGLRSIRLSTFTCMFSTRSMVYRTLEAPSSIGLARNGSARWMMLLRSLKNKYHHHRPISLIVCISYLDAFFIQVNELMIRLDGAMPWRCNAKYIANMVRCQWIPILFGAWAKFFGSNSLLAKGAIYFVLLVCSISEFSLPACLPPSSSSPIDSPEYSQCFHCTVT